VAYDEGLAERIRRHLSGQPGVVEKKMFGGLSFMVDGNLCVGVIGDELCARVDPGGLDAALRRRGAHVFDFSGRPAKGMVSVAPSGLEDDDAFAAWVDESLAHVRTLPPK
jgi:TfoX/Sxy family transcriptional regulator of competence genes